MTTIEWTHRPGTKGESWNPIRARNLASGKIGHYCVKVSAGCANCYAERLQCRFGNDARYAAQDRDKVDIFLDEEVLLKPLRWRSPRTIFVCSMTDLFGEWIAEDLIDRIFAVMALCPQHTFQVLTKRAERMRDYMSGARNRVGFLTLVYALRGTGDINEEPYQDPENRPWPLRNVWLGVSCECQSEANKRIPDLLATPAAVRFVSCEPLLGPIDLRAVRWVHATALTGLDWVIVGGESGPHARPMYPDWARSLRDQCKGAGVSFFFKQWGDWADADAALRPGECSIGWRTRLISGVGLVRCGKKRAGRLLDGVEHNEWPEMRAEDKFADKMATSIPAPDQKVRDLC